PLIDPRLRLLHALADALHLYLSNLFCHFSSFFFFNDTATTEIYTLSLHDALPILTMIECGRPSGPLPFFPRSSSVFSPPVRFMADRKSTRLNSSHEWISYAVFCLKKKISTIMNV